MHKEFSSKTLRKNSSWNFWKRSWKLCLPSTPKKVWVAPNVH